MLLLAEGAELLEKRIRDEGVKTRARHRAGPAGRIAQAVAAGILTRAEGASLAEFDRKVMQIVRVDDFAPHELMPGSPWTGFVSADRPV